MYGLCAMMAGADRDAVAVEQLGDVVGMDAIEVPINGSRNVRPGEIKPTKMPPIS